MHDKLYVLKLTMAVDNFVLRIFKLKRSILMFISISYVCVFVQYHQMVIYNRNVSSYRQVLSMPVIIIYSICL